MKTDILAIATQLLNADHILRSQMGRNAKGSPLLNKQGLPGSDRFVKLTEFAGAQDKTPKAVKDARAFINAWAVISPLTPEFTAEVDKAKAALTEEARLKSVARTSGASDVKKAA